MNTRTNPLTPADLWLAGCRATPLSAAQQDSSHYAEGQFIRSLFYSQHLAQSGDRDLPSPSESSEQRHWQQILERIRQDGSVTSEANSGQSQSAQLTGWSRFAAVASNQQWYALAASIAVLGIGLTVLMQGHDKYAEDNAVIMRGDEAALRIAVPPGKTPEEVAQQIEAVLLKHNVPYRRIELANSGVQIQAKVPIGSPVRAELQSIGVKLPRHERLNIVFAKAPLE